MQKLSLISAHEYVLQVLDEIKNSDDFSMLEGAEGLDTMKLTEGFIIEAVIKAHKDAPSLLLDGKVAEGKTEAEAEGKIFSAEVKERVADIKMLKETVRLVSIKASDSPFVVADYASEESPIGRMQNNKYVRGTYDDPRLIVKKIWGNERMPEFYYYSTKDDTATFTVEYIPYPTYPSEVEISDKLKYAVLSLLVSMVLDALSLHDKAALYKAKYQEYLQTAR